MNVSTVTALREAKEPTQEEPTQPVSGQSSENQSAFAVLLALLQGLGAQATAENASGTATLEGQGDGQEAPPPAGALVAQADSTATQSLLNAVTAKSAATSAETIAGETATATGTNGPAPDAMANAAGISSPGATANTVADQLEAPGANSRVAQGSIGAESGLPADAGQIPAQASVAAAEGRQGKSETKPVQETPTTPKPSVEDGEVNARPVVVAKVDPGENSDEQTGTPERSSARYVVAKAGTASGDGVVASGQVLQESVPVQSKAGLAAAESMENSGDTANALEAAAPRLNAMPQSEEHATAAPKVQARVDQTFRGETPALSLVSMEPAAEGPAQTAVDSAEPSQATLKTLAHDTVKGVRYLLARGEQTLRIRLIPESLGELRLEVTSSKDEISVRLSSANQTVRELLHTQVHSLRDALTQDGTAVSRISIVADTGTGMASQGGTADRAFSQQARAWTESGSHASTNTPQSRQQSLVAPRSQAPHSGALNLFA